MTAFLIIITMISLAGMAFAMWGFASEDHMLAIGSWLLHPSLPHPRQDKRKAAALACRQAIERLEADLNTSDTPDIVTFTEWTIEREQQRQELREQQKREEAHMLDITALHQAMDILNARSRDAFINQLHK